MTRKSETNNMLLPTINRPKFKWEIDRLAK